MSYGEEWDLAMREAAASGLHLIAPKHSAYTTYLDETIADLIPAKKVPAKFRWSDSLHKLFRGAEWWEPDAGSAANLIEVATKNATGKKNLKARVRVMQNLTWEKAAKRLIAILDEFEVRINHTSF